MCVSIHVFKVSSRRSISRGRLSFFELKPFDAFAGRVDVRIGIEPYIDPFATVTRHEEVVVTYGFVLESRLLC